VTELAPFLLVAAAVLVVGVALGMLVAPRLGRLAEREDDEPGDDDRG
jgi:hypothetical protein